MGEIPFIMVCGFAGRVKPAGQFLAPGGIGKGTNVPKRALFFPGMALLFSELGLAHVRQKSRMGSAALSIVGTGLGQAEASVHGEPYIGGVAIFLAVIFPPADGAQGQRFWRLQSFISAAWATKTGHHSSP